MYKLVDSNDYSIKVKQVHSADSKEGYIARENILRKCIL